MSKDMTNIEAVELEQFNHVRASMYQLLSSLFAKEIDQSSLQELTNTRANEFWSSLSNEHVFKADINVLLNVFLSLKTQEALLELAADYCGLFLVESKFSASPYASFYQDPDKEEILLFGEKHQQMMQFLKQSQLQIQGDFREPADHLAVILAYIAHLCLHSKQTQQLEFINNYLANWLSKFVDKVCQADKGNFYQALARLTLSWMQFDLALLEEEL